MVESMTGKIVYTHIGKIPQTGEKYGIITLKTSDDENFELKIDKTTEYDELWTGSTVTVVFEEDENSEHPIAKQITSVDL